MKTILFVYWGHFSYLPPFQALVDALLSTGEYKLKVICSEEEPDMDMAYKHPNIEFIHYYELEPRTGIISRVRNRLKAVNYFRKRLKKDLDTLQFDILWIIHEFTIVNIQDLLKNRKFILSVYELRSSSESKVYKALKNTCMNAKVNVVCEENRAWISKHWFNLDKLPVILPNKPFKHPGTKNISTDAIKVDGRKIILYQGIISRERNLDGMCKAISSLDGFKLVFMGKKTEYYEELKSKYDNIEYIGYFKSPAHLCVTSNAYIGLVTYEPQDLNCIYCAPNKIWEYSGFGIPMIGNSIPGLKQAIERFECGICTDTDDPNSIVEAIKKIDSNYDVYSGNSLRLYRSCDLQTIIGEILNEYEN